MKTLLHENRLLFGGLLILGIAYILSVIGNFDVPEVSIDPSQVTVKEDEVFTVYFRIKSRDNLTGFVFALTYDPTKLEAVETVDLGAVEVPDPFSIFDNYRGTANFWTLPDVNVYKGVPGANLLVAKMSFRAKSAGTTYLEFAHNDDVNANSPVKVFLYTYYPGLFGISLNEGGRVVGLENVEGATVEIKPKVDGPRDIGLNAVGQ